MEGQTGGYCFTSRWGRGGAAFTLCVEWEAVCWQGTYSTEARLMPPVPVSDVGMF